MDMPLSGGCPYEQPLLICRLLIQKNRGVLDMRKKLVIAATGILWIVVSGMWIFLGEKSEELVLPERKITFISPMANSGYWGNVAGGIMDRGEQYNIHVKCVGFSELNLEKQVYALENAILSGVDGIVTVAYEDSKSFRQVMESAEEAGIPVVFVDSYIPDLGQLCYVGSDNFSAGQLAGETLAQECGGKAKTAIITSYSSNANQAERIAGFKEALQGYPEMEILEILEGQSKTALLKERIMHMLEEQPEIDALFCAEGYGTSTMGYLMQENKEKLRNLKMVLFDGSQLINQMVENEDSMAVVRQKPYEMGCEAVEVLEKYFSDGREGIKDQYIDVEIFDQDNMVSSGYKTREDILWHIY